MSENLKPEGGVARIPSFLFFFFFFLAAFLITLAFLKSALAKKKVRKKKKLSGGEAESACVRRCARAAEGYDVDVGRAIMHAK